ncbi:hypothetical protein DXG03_007445 [Asterophora parasitica]|uniref:Uncharacterized protein n=1 Tax=Asterophora parasitica TaxID=117018 RepID=A0A9P7KBT6_9AGAR|nr:hypothetical protein DXG03_007445 [Asterophora parasitica]
MCSDYFSVQDLQDLFNDLMKVALAITLPTPNASKTWSLVFWTIQTQNLPLTILSTRKDDVVKALRQGLHGEKGLQAQLDSFKAIHSLLKSQPELFVSSLSGFLPTVLENLVSVDEAYRLPAAHSLSGFALAKISELLFDGTLLEATAGRVEDVVRSLAEVKIDRIRQLSEEELVFHWDGLVETWTDSMEKDLREPSRFSRELLNVWQSLLLAQAHLTQEHGDLSAPSSFAGQIAGIVNHFIADTDEVDTQVRRLIVVKKLWGVMKNVYSHSWLPAETILAAVTRIQFSLGNESVRAAWSQLCADLISVGVPSLLHVITARSEKGEGQEVTRQLWAVLARDWQVSSGGTHWEELASFLGIPFKAWVLSDAEFELWEATLKTAVSLADSKKALPTTVVIRILQRLGQKELDALMFSPKEVAALLAYVDLSGSTTLPAQLLDVVDRTLTSNYPPRSEKLSACLDILYVLGRIIRNTSIPLLARLLCVMEKSLCCWIGDEKEILLGSEHEVILKALYCVPLDILRNLPRSRETLLAISPFLSSAFGRLTPSAMGPLAFSEFWRATYHGVDEYRPSYPDSLKACLMALTDAFGGSIADGLSINGPSQVTV